MKAWNSDAGLESIGDKVEHSLGLLKRSHGESDVCLDDNNNRSAIWHAKDCHAHYSPSS